jgi:branched-chain amino acid transport system permease protein
MTRPPRGIVAVALLAALATVPVWAVWSDQPFYLTLFARIAIFAIAALSLDLILGYGGLVSFGHAAYLGVGAYAVGILDAYGLRDGWLHLAVAVVASALVAWAIGAVSLRTSGVYFIMITLAFAQMLYFLGVSLKSFGGDDGMTLAGRSRFPGVDLKNTLLFYYVVLATLAASLALGHRLVESRFGMVVRGARSNEPRMRAIGFATYRYRLLAFVVAGTMCGVAGFLLANLTEFVTPAFMHWTRSGEVLIMVIFGGMGTLVGPVLGAVALLLLEETLASWTQHWMIVLGPILVGIVLFARAGLVGLLPGGGTRG